MKPSFLPQQLYSLQQQGHVYPAWPPSPPLLASRSTLQNCAVSSTFVSLNEILLSTTIGYLIIVSMHLHAFLQIDQFTMYFLNGVFLHYCYVYYGTQWVLLNLDSY